MTDKETMKLALEALENLFGIPDKWTGEGGGDVAVWRLGGSYRAQQAITAIKEALAQPEQEPVAWMFEDDEDNGHKTFRQTPPSPEVVAYLAKWNRPEWVPIYTTPPQRTWVGLTDEEGRSVCRVGPVYAPDGVVTRNPLEYRKELQGVALMAVRQAEAKLKEKNHEHY